MGNILGTGKALGRCEHPVDAVLKTLQCIEHEDVACTLKGYSDDFKFEHNEVAVDTKYDEAFWAGTFQLLDLKFDYNHIAEVGKNYISLRFLNKISVADGAAFGNPTVAAKDLIQHEHALITVDNDCKMVHWSQYGDNAEQQAVEDAVDDLLNPPAPPAGLPPCFVVPAGTPCDDTITPPGGPTPPTGPPAGLPPCFVVPAGTPCDDTITPGGPSNPPSGDCTTPSPITTFPIDVEEFTRASWFVQEQMETPQTSFPEDFFCVSATYDRLVEGTVAPRGVGITASNAGAVENVSGKTTGVVLCVGESDVSGKLFVAPCPIFEFIATPNFNVLDVGVNEETGEYEWAVILGGGAPQRRATADGLCLPNPESGLFLYTRNKVATKEEIEAMRNAVTAAGVSTSELKPVEQIGCTYDRRLKPSDLAGPAVPTDFGAFCPNGFPQGDPQGDCGVTQTGPPCGRAGFPPCPAPVEPLVNEA